jgi:signal transduction histidine kinase
MAKRLSSPLEGMTSALYHGTPIDTELETSSSNVHELNELSNAITERDKRIQTLVTREGQFNRDISHELRTPLTIASGAIELLEKDLSGNPAFERLQTATTDMQLLTEGILWLGRDNKTGETCDAISLCKHVVKSHQHIIKYKPITVSIENESETYIPVPQPVGQVIIGNLIRNAFTYTEEGTITVKVSPRSIALTDTGIGFGLAEEEKAGFGIGLSLVERLCTHFHLAFDIKAHPETRGSIAQISWE